MFRGPVGARVRAFAMVAAFVAGLFVVTPPAPVYATSITVNTATDPAPNAETGRYPDDNLCSLRAAIQSAQYNSNSHDSNCATGLGNNVLDIIQIDPSLAGQTLAMFAKPFEKISGPDNPMEIRGPTTNASQFAIDGQNATRIFELGFITLPSARGVLKIANLTIKRGNGQHPGDAWFPQGDGGAIAMADSSHLTLDNVVLRDNVATSSARGGAIYAVSSTITNNGGAYINNSTAGNGGTGAGGGRGGAVFMVEGPSVLNGYAVLFEGNNADYAGGAVATNPGNMGALVHLERSLAKNNTATVGGLVYVDSTKAEKVLELHDSTIVGNTASQGGGVIFTTSTAQSYEYLRSTFVDNTGIGGLYNAGRGFIANSIMINNTCKNTTDVSFHTGSRNLGGCGAGSIGAPTGVSSTLAQNGGPEVQQTYRLSSGSNAIDNGDPAYCGTIDARSVPRGVNGAGAVDSPQVGDCDIGAYEYADYIVNFVTGSSSVLEGTAVQVQVKLTIPDPASRPLPSNVVVNINRNAASTARSGVDYAVPAGTATFAAGTGASGTATVNYTVSTINDNVAERFGEKILLDLAPNTAGVAIAEPRQHDLSIQDDDQAGILKFDTIAGTTAAGTRISEIALATTDFLEISLRSQPDYSQPDPTDSNSVGPPADVTVRLEPDRDCTATVGSTTARLGNPLTFTILNANWQTRNRVTVAPLDDFYDEDPDPYRNEALPHDCTLTFTFTSTDPVYGATTDRYDVKVTDNDTAGVTLVQSGGTTAAEEGGLTDTYTVVLNSQPDPGDPPPFTPRRATSVVATADQQCDLDSTSDTKPSKLGTELEWEDYAVSQGLTRSQATALTKAQLTATYAPLKVTFTEANWNVPQTVTVTAVDDPTVELGHLCAIAHTIDAGDPVYANLDDPPAFAFTPAGVTSTLQDFQPPTLLNDPPNAVLTTGAQGLDVDEGTAGTADTFDVVLFRQPLTHNVTVTLGSSSDPRIPGTQLLLQDDVVSTPAAPAGTLALTFTPANWDQPQRVKVLAVDDDYDEPDTHAAHITATMASTAVGFNDAALRKFVLDGVESLDTVDVPVALTDNDTSSILVTQSGGSTAATEGGATDTYSFRLGTHPYDDVTVTVDPAAECDIGDGPGVSRTFPVPHNDWKMPVNVTVTAVDDRLAEVAETCRITHVANSIGDVLYENLAGPNVDASITDNDPARVLITTLPGITVDEADAATTGSYSLVLASQPDGDVHVDISAADGQTLVDNGSAAPTDTLRLTFTNADWEMPQTVKVTVVDDAVDEGDVPTNHTGTLAHSVTSTATVYDTASEISVDGTPSTDVDVVIVDNDVANVTLTESGTGTSFAEGGSTDDYSLTLDTEPAENVVIDIDPDAQCTTDPSSLTFTPEDWDTAQKVTITAVDDATVEHGHECLIIHTIQSTDPFYAGLDDPPALAFTAGKVTGAVTDLDNDHPNALVDTGTGGIDVDEATPGTGDTLEVVLEKRPLTHSVTVTLSAAVDPVTSNPQLLLQDDDSATAAAPASTVSLVFTPTNWDAPQTVNVFALDDAFPEAATAAAISATMSSSAVGFSDPTIRKFVLDGTETLDTATIPVTVSDNDVASLVVSETGGGTSITEGGTTDTYTFALGTHPFADVDVVVDPDAQCDIGAGAGASRTFSVAAANWNVPVTVDVTAVDDRVTEAAKTCTITNATRSTGDPAYEGVSGDTVTVNVTDDDPGRVLVDTLAGLTLSEAAAGTTDTYEVVLASKPDADVRVQLSAADGQTLLSRLGDSGSPANTLTLTFTADNWNAPQTVVVRVVNDEVDEAASHQGRITHSISSSATIYKDANLAEIHVDGAPGSDVDADIADNDTAGITLTQTGGGTAIEEASFTDTYSLRLNTKPVANVVLSISPDAQCTASPASVTFTATNWNAPQTITLTAVKDGVVEPTQSCVVSHSVASQDDNYDAMALANLVATVTENRPPVASFTGPTTGTAAFTAKFNGSASSDLDGTVVAYLWNFGDGTYGSGATPSHLYDTSGVYTIRLRVTDDRGATNTRTATLTVKPHARYTSFRWVSPTKTMPEINYAKGGSVVSVKFTLGGYHGMNIFPDTWPKHQRFVCPSGQLVAGTQWAARPFGKSGLTYDAATKVYTYRWTTSTAYNEVNLNCRQFQLKLNDDLTRRAAYKFRP